MHAENPTLKSAIADGNTELLALGFFRGDVEPQQVTLHRHGFDLQKIEETGAHEQAESFVKHIRAVSLTGQFAEPLRDKTRPQPLKTTHRHAIKAVNRSGRDHDLHRHATIDGLLRRAGRFDLHIVITARFEIGLEASRNIGDTRIGVRLLQEIEHLSAQRFRCVNCLPGK